MNWKNALIPRKVAGFSHNYKTFYREQENGFVRFYVMRGTQIWFTRCYETMHEAMTQLPDDFAWSQGWKAA